ncbi:MAG TPA: O-antigen ligase family protein [Candidatus Limnocylindrales bacterium]|nr:O-antigen ligase family protein [Candidatus Limnocylindrales bacterium]
MAATPILVGTTYTTQQRRHLVDVGFLICTMVVVLAVIPSPLAVPGFSELGHPGTLIALFIFGVWCLSRTHPRLATHGPQPLRWTVFLFFTSVLASYAAGLMRGMPSIEDNAAVRAIIGTFALVGIILAIADGVHQRERIDDIIRVMLVAGSIIGIIGIMQAVLVFDITQYIQIPGLVYHGNLNGLESRGALYRVASTTGHYIEFSTVMALLLPFAVHMARFAPTRPMRQWCGIAGGIMFLALPIALSRTGIVALAVALIVMVPAWSWRMRFNLVVPSTGLLIVLIFVMPGLLGTLLGLFDNWDNDASVQGRDEDWDMIMERGWLDDHWIFGRGQGTFIPTEYTWLDNQWLQQLVGGGIVGVAALASIHLAAIVLSAIAYRRATQLADRHLCACLIAAQMVAIAVGFTFDSLGFRTYAFFIAILTGAAGALWRIITKPEQQTY